MRDAILILNAGSSSVKFAICTVAERDFLAHGQLAGIGSEKQRFEVKVAAGSRSQKGDIEAQNHEQALDWIMAWLHEAGSDWRIKAAGHRVVHGGPRRAAPERVTPKLLVELDRYSPLAPHHQPHNLAAIRAVETVSPGLPQVACFDTAFHATQPDVCRLLPLPKRLRDKGLMRYGFHGSSYEYLVEALPSYVRGNLPRRLIIAHLGNGASACAILDGKSYATTMGFSTLDGLLMGTRCGSLDPGVILHLMRSEGLDAAALTRLLYEESGLLGVSGISSDMRDLLSSDAPAAQQAVDFYVLTLVRALGSLAAAMQGVDAIVFSGGVGENASFIRAEVLQRLSWLGCRLDVSANHSGGPRISRSGGVVSAWVVPTNEEAMIAAHTTRLLAL